MYLVEDRFGSLYLTDVNTREVITELVEPAISFSHHDGVIVVRKIGNKSFVQKDYDQLTKKLLDAGLSDMIEEYFIMDLPKDPAILNEVYNNPQYIRGLLGTLPT